MFRERTGNNEIKIDTWLPASQRHCAGDVPSAERENSTDETRDGWALHLVPNRNRFPVFSPEPHASLHPDACEVFPEMTMKVITSLSESTYCFKRLFWQRRPDISAKEKGAFS